MMFIVRSTGAQPEAPGVQVKLGRKTPPNLPDAEGKTDFFCVGEAEAMAALRASGWTIVELHDGYYEDGLGGGVTPFTIKEAVGPTAAAEPGPAEGEQVNVRGAIFGV